jgi:hypothetical protein
MARRVVRPSLVSVPLGIVWYVLLFRLGIVNIPSGARELTFDAAASMLFMLSFIAAGLVLIIRPLWVHHRARRTVYVVTDRRAFTVTAGLGSNLTIRSFLPEQLHGMHRHQRKDGSGDLVLMQEEIHDPESGTYKRNAGFLAVRDVAEVEALVREMRDSHTGILT